MRELTLTRRGQDWVLTYGEVRVTAPERAELIEPFLNAHQDRIGAVDDATRTQIFELLCLEEAG